MQPSCMECAVPLQKISKDMAHSHLHEHHCESCLHEQEHHHEHHQEHSMKKQLWLIIATVILLVIAVLIERGSTLHSSLKQLATATCLSRTLFVDRPRDVA